MVYHSWIVHLGNSLSDASFPASYVTGCQMSKVDGISSPGHGVVSDLPSFGPQGGQSHTRHSETLLCRHHATAPCHPISCHATSIQSTVAILRFQTLSGNRSRNIIFLNKNNPTTTKRPPTRCGRSSCEQTTGVADPSQ